IVVAADMSVPDLMEIDNFTVNGQQPIGIGMRLGIENAIAVEKAAVVDLLARSVEHTKIKPTLVDVPLFGDQAVADAAILEDQVNNNGIAGRHLKGAFLHGSDQRAIVPVNPEEINTDSLLKEVCRLLQLLGVAIVSRN